MFRHDPSSLAWVETGLHLSPTSAFYEFAYAFLLSNKGHHVHPGPFVHLLHLLLGPSSLWLLWTFPGEEGEGLNFKSEEFIPFWPIQLKLCDGK